MEKVIKKISKKAGIKDEQSLAALTAILGMLKQKMPDSLGGQLEGLLLGHELNLTEVFKEVSVHKIEEMKETASHKIEEIKETASEKAGVIKDKIKKLF
jgi:hypothetical protein